MPDLYLPAFAAASRLRWPLPALLAWLAAWGAAAALAAAGVPAAPARAAAALTLAAAAGCWPGAAGAWRRLLTAAGYPLALVAAGAAAWPGWVWAAALALLMLAYPLRAWRDAPWFPTPRAALRGLSGAAALPAGARILDAGCGLGDGLAALHREWPGARLDGIEWSWPLRGLAGLRCPWARVRRADMWSADWSPYAMVYLFQRPESMARALAKAEREMAPGAWLASLDFEVPGRRADAVVRHAGLPPVRLYRLRGSVAQPAPRPADIAPRTVAMRRGR